ncbi:MAG: serine hydrolase [Legionella sp.]|jgi:D-alanyl-D-alanine carboxypeptidase
MKTILGIFLLSISTFTCAKSSDNFANTIQKIVNEHYQTHKDKEGFTAIQASILIPKDKKIDANDIKTVVAGTVGFPPFTQAINANSLFEIGSITKSFVAVIILQLQTDGTLTLDDKLGKWLPQYKNWSQVSLRQLLTMTSAIPNYSEDPVFDKKMYANLQNAWTNEELLKYAHPEQPLKKSPGTAFEYSNSNYILASMVIEKATHDTFEHQLQTRILNQGSYFKNTYYPVGADAKTISASIASRQVHGYYFNKKTNKNVDTSQNNLSWAAAAGALVSNTEDVVRWVQLLYHGLLIDARYRERALAELEAVVSMKTGRRIPTVTADDPAGFGLGVGWFYDKQSKQRFWVYKGSTLGFRVMYFWKSCNDVTIAVALNSKAGEGDPKSKMGDAIAELNLKLYQAIIDQYPQLQCT